MFYAVCLDMNVEEAIVFQLCCFITGLNPTSIIVELQIQNIIPIDLLFYQKSTFPKNYGSRLIFYSSALFLFSLHDVSHPC